MSGITTAHTILASGAVTIDLDWTFLAHFVLFSAFVVIMKDLVFDPLLKVFEEREKRTQGAVDRARAMDEQAIALKGELDDKMEGVRREAAIDRDKNRAKLKKIELEAMAEARSTVSTKLDEGMGKLDKEASAIRTELAGQRNLLAEQIASRVLGRELKGQG